MQRATGQVVAAQLAARQVSWSASWARVHACSQGSQSWSQHSFGRAHEITQSSSVVQASGVVGPPMPPVFSTGGAGAGAGSFVQAASRARITTAVRMREGYPPPARRAISRA